MGMCSSQGILAGAHRYYAHRSYKANLPLRMLIVLFHTVATQNCMWVWVRDHRQHHKFSDTDADPHNASRGFFFSHVGWLMMKKHPDVIEKGKTIDMSDLDSDPLIMFQKKNIRPVETMVVSIVAFGEGWHNYHHTFPWDYKASEFGVRYNPTTAFINFLAKIGWAYDLKQASPSLVRARALRSGDGTHGDIVKANNDCDTITESIISSIKEPLSKDNCCMTE
ncbi:hypothetical protein FOCC_FOCC013205 [Frankliniella occidentalis]|nr:hypothetical protein FOCC_FOCC013205 [Frankliniella occidentalis]